MASKISRNLLKALGIFVLNTLLGAYLFRVFEGLNLFDSIYWAVTVVSTVGFGDITPSTTGGRVVFIYLVFTSLAIYGYIAGSLGSLLIEAKVGETLRRMLGMGNLEMRDHVIIVGWNPVTRMTAKELEAQGIRYVVADSREGILSELSARGIPVVRIDLSDPESLRRTGIDDAKAVIVHLENDPETIMCILAVRSINKDVEVVAGIDDPKSIKLAKEAGATRVMLPEDIAGRVLASVVFEPRVAEVIQDLASSKEGELDMIERVAERDARVSEIEEELRSKILAVYRGSERFILPDSQFEIKRGDILVLAARERA